MVSMVYISGVLMLLGLQLFIYAPNFIVMIRPHSQDKS